MQSENWCASQGSKPNASFKDLSEEEEEQEEFSSSSVPTTKECIEIVETFPGFEEGSRDYLQALCVFLNESTRVHFMIPKTHETKMEFLKMLIDMETPTTKECMEIVETFPGFEEGSLGYLQALCVFLNESTRENFISQKTHTAKMGFLKALIDREKEKITN